MAQPPGKTPPSLFEVASDAGGTTLRWPPLRPGIHHYFAVPFATLGSFLASSMLLWSSVAAAQESNSALTRTWWEGYGMPLATGGLGLVCGGLGIYWLRLLVRETRPESIRLDATCLRHDPGWPSINPFRERGPWDKGNRPRDDWKHTFQETTVMRRGQLKNFVLGKGRITLDVDSWWSNGALGAIGVGLSEVELAWVHDLLASWLESNGGEGGQKSV